ncbi:MAG: BREX-3 system P-loop-containing protein BrxF [Nitrospina sp.]|jgi:hypothetical protein|nr:BREX-3 system P-loop-containing protein BrxF [Nitrospina sp.]
MAETLADQVIQKIRQAPELYHKLVLIIAPAGTGKTTVLRDVMERIDSSLINVNLELSRRLLDLTKRQRPLKVTKALDEILISCAGPIVLLDNTEILFDFSLQIDPLRLLQELSRNKIVVATWNGTIQGDHMNYAVPEHPEYRRYKIQDFLVVSPEAI